MNHKNLSTLLWSAGFLIFPFYFFGSGGIQVSTPILFLAALLSMASEPSINAVRRAQERKLNTLFLFLVYAAAVQILWAWLLSEPSMLVAPFYYLFNGVLCIGLLRHLTASEEHLRQVGLAIFASVVLQLALSFSGVDFGQGLRNALFFNNPNQLGYFSILAAGFLTAAVKFRCLGYSYYVVGIIGCIWLAQLSLSKSAMLSGLLMLLFGSKGRSLPVLAVVAGVVLLAPEMLSDRLASIEARFSTIGLTNDDNLLGRGYDRILLYPQYLLFGAGEGAFYRWDSWLKGAEMHSTWGTLLFSYGLPGLGLMMVFFFRAATSIGLVSMVIILVVAAYGLTHHGLRFSPMWLLCAYLFGLNYHYQKVPAVLRSARALVHQGEQLTGPANS